MYLPHYLTEYSNHEKMYIILINADFNLSYSLHYSSFCCLTNQKEISVFRQLDPIGKRYAICQYWHLFSFGVEFE